MRITGGALVRRRFLVPPLADEGLVRPTPDRVREAVFSMLKPHLENAFVLDLFAGSGAHGLEALSRGARFVRFVERDPRTAAVIKENVASLDLVDKCRIDIADAVQAVAQNASEKADIIFADPPYTLTLDREFFVNARRHLAEDGTLVFRCFKKQEPDIGDEWTIERDRVYAGTRVFVMRSALT